MRLPPLNALRAFEAAARHGSFVRAAGELNVTAGAISRQVKILEDHLGVALFTRHAQGLTPTEKALALLPRLSSAFDDITAAVAELRPTNTELRVICAPTLANRWLVPRLPRFRDRNPQVTLELGTSLFDHDQILTRRYDCAIVTAPDPHWPDELGIERIKDEQLTPLCAPAIYVNRAGWESSAGINADLLIHISPCESDWPNWLAANHIHQEVETNRGSSVDTGEMAVRAAVQGLGVILFDRYLVEDELAEQKLVDMFPASVPVNNGYFLVCEQSRSNEPAIAMFREWLLSELLTEN